MDLEKIEYLSKQAGLQETFEKFPEDVAFAVQAAASICADASPPSDPAAEPWPDMHLRSERCTG